MKDLFSFSNSGCGQVLSVVENVFLQRLLIGRPKNQTRADSRQLSGCSKQLTKLSGLSFWPRGSREQRTTVEIPPNFSRILRFKDHIKRKKKQLLMNFCVLCTT